MNKEKKLYQFCLDLIKRHNIKDLCYHSDNVVNNSLFIIPKSFKNIHNIESKIFQYIKIAQLKGACCVISYYDISNYHDGDLNFPIYVRSDIFECAAQITNILFSLNGIIDNISIISMTGTNGKTSSTYCLFNALNNVKDANISSKNLYIGTLGILSKDDESNKDNNDILNSKKTNTMPEHPYLHKILLNKSNNTKNMIMEASSYGLSCMRMDGILSDISVFLNCQIDHIEMHGNQENYKNAKLLLFSKYTKSNGIGIFNADDYNYEYFMKNAQCKNKYTFSIYSNSKSHAYVINIQEMKEYGHYKMKISIFNEIYELELKNYYIKYQLYSAIVTAFCMYLIGININDIDPIDCYIPGRMYVKKYQNVNDKNAFNVAIVDFAHNPAAVFNILKSFYNKRVTCIIGSGGCRDTYKRESIAKIAMSMSDRFIITDDNYRMEDPSQIRSQMHKYAPEALNIPGRFEAISYAVNTLQDDELLLVLGKGFEEYIDGMGLKIPFQDTEVLDFCFNKNKFKL